MGLHCRASACVAYIAKACSPDWDIVGICGDVEQDAKDIMGVMLLNAYPGAEIEFVSLLPQKRWKIFVNSLDNLFFTYGPDGKKDASYLKVYSVLRELDLLDEKFAQKEQFLFSKVASLPLALANAAQKYDTGRFLERLPETIVTPEKAQKAIEHIEAVPKPSGSAIDIFISHDTRDLRLAQWFYNACCSRNLNAFLAALCLPSTGSTDFFREVERALEMSRNFVLISSNAAYLEGGWVRAEWTTFLNEKRSGRKDGNLITLRTQDVSLRDLPFMLRAFQSEIIPAESEIETAKIERILRFLGVPVMPG